MSELGLKPLARIHDATVAAVDPREMGIGPVPADSQTGTTNGMEVGGLFGGGIE